MADECQSESTGKCNNQQVIGKSYNVYLKTILCSTIDLEENGIQSDILFAHFLIVCLLTYITLTHAS
jgi:hypothetical protein